MLPLSINIKPPLLTFSDSFSQKIRTRGRSYFFSIYNKNFFINMFLKKTCLFSAVTLISRHDFKHPVKTVAIISRFVPNFIIKHILQLFLNLNKFVNKIRSAKYFYVGLGYKMFLYKKSLFIWVGLTHYTILPLPRRIKIFPKKRRIYLLGVNKSDFREFLMTIRRVRKMDIYKGKGLLEVKTYKGFIKMKSGKKKQY